MDADRWNQIDAIFQSLLEQPPEDRAAYLDEVCSGDESLRQEIEAYISYDEQTWSLLDRPAFEVAAPILSRTRAILDKGQHLAHYEILDLIGAGGMGEVYLAQDTILGRKVALKLLPENFTRSDLLVERFRQEARTVSTLNHPNILTIHGIAQDAGHHFIATEFIEGETLRRRMQHSRLSVNETLDIAIQVASALAAAHQAGIIHRDIKPENIMLRTDGYVKVLDFGLAKLAEQDAPGKMEGNGDATAEHSSGLLMGTLRYMSPEQARRETIDARSDIFSFGVVLYEMLAGCRPFEAETVADHLTALSSISLSALVQKVADVPEEIHTITGKALCIDKNERYPSMTEMLESLKRLKQEIASSKESNRNIIHSLYQRPFKKNLVPVAAVLISTLALLIFFVINYTGRKTKSHFQKVKLTSLTTSGKARDAAISPDGKYAAYVVDEPQQESLWVKQTSTGESRELVPQQGVRYAAVTFSPDSNSVYFVKYEKDSRQNALYQIPISGGEAKRIIAEVHSPVSFSPDSTSFAFIRRLQGSRENALMIAKSDGSAEEEIGRREQPELFADYPSGPAWSPRGDSIVCGVGRWTSGQPSPVTHLFEFQVKDKTEKIINDKDLQLMLGLTWLSNGNGLIAIIRDCQETKFPCPILPFYIPYPDGEPRRFISESQRDDYLGVRYMGVSVDASSKMLVTTGEVSQENIWTAPFETPDQIKQISSGSNNFGGCWTPDGRIVYSSRESGNEEVWIMDADGTNKKQLTFEPKYAGWAVPSPDSKYIVFGSNQTGSMSPWRMDMDGSNVKQLTTIGTCQVISPDGKWVIYQIPKGEIRTLWKVSIDGGEPVQLTYKDECMAAISPDGRLIAYHYKGVKTNSDAGIAIMPFAGGAPIKHFDLPQGFRHFSVSRWTPDGRAIIYLSDSGEVSNLYVQPIDDTPKKQITHFKSNIIERFDLSFDGRQITYDISTTAKNVFLISEEE